MEQQAIVQRLEKELELARKNYLELNKADFKASNPGNKTDFKSSNPGKF